MLRVCATFVLLCLPFLAFAEPNGVVRVIDADTWDVGDQRVRLFGIDAPELAQTCTNAKGETWACGLWASDLARKRFDGKNARCDAITHDRYGRVVARCFVGDMDVGRELVADGLAFAYRKYSLAYDLDEKGAAVNARGLHTSTLQSPSEFRAARLTNARDSDPPTDHDCVIKGNISRQGARIYHVPGQRGYFATRIRTGKGERWFCTEDEARNSGWRRARR